MTMQLMRGCVWSGLLLSALWLGGCDLSVDITVDEELVDLLDQSDEDTSGEVVDSELDVEDVEGDRPAEEPEEIIGWPQPENSDEWPIKQAQCDGEYLTRDECLAAQGVIDGWVADHQLCIDGERRYCCIAGELKNPCPGACAAPAECFGWRNDPNDEGGDHMSQYECSHTFDVCCAPSTVPVVPQHGESFRSQGCPIEKTDYQPTAQQQPNFDAAMICMEHLYQQDGEEAPWYCPQKLYERIASELSMLEQAYPMMAEHNIQLYDEFADLLMCVAMTDCHDFPKSHFDGLEGCFGDYEANCLFEQDGKCSQTHLHFEVPFNVWRALPYFEKHAQTASANSVCEPNQLFGAFGPIGQVHGYHLTTVDEISGFHVYTLRAAAQFSMGTAACDLIIEVAVSPSGAVTELSRQDLGDATCETPEFL